MSAVEEGSAAAEYLLPGDEIVQVSSDVIMMSSVYTIILKMHFLYCVVCRCWASRPSI